MCSTKEITPQKDLFRGECLFKNESLISIFDDGDIFEGFNINGSYVYFDGTGNDDCFFFDTNPIYIQVKNLNNKHVLYVFPSSMNYSMIKDFLFTSLKIPHGTDFSVIDQNTAINVFNRTPEIIVAFPVRFGTEAYKELKEALLSRDSDIVQIKDIDYLFDLSECAPHSVSSIHLT